MVSFLGMVVDGYRDVGIRCVEFALPVFISAGLSCKIYLNCALKRYFPFSCRV